MPCTVTIPNVHYDAGDPDMGPEDIVLEVVSKYDAPFDYRVDRDGPSRAITYQCPGDHAPFAVDSLVGVGNFSSPIHSYATPHQYPDNEGLRCLGAGLHSFVGYAKPGRFAQTAKYARITANYGIIPWDPIGLEWATMLGMTVPWTYVNIDIGHFLMTVPYASNADNEEVRNVPIIVPEVTYTFRRTMIPDFVAYKTIVTDLVGKVNLGTWFGEAEETVLFHSFGMSEEERDPSGARVFTFTGVFKWRPAAKHWNLHPRNGRFRTWSRLKDVATQDPYEKISFAPLLEYGIL